MTIQQYLIQASGNMLESSLLQLKNLQIYQMSRFAIFLIVQFVCPRTCTLVGTEPDERSAYNTDEAKIHKECVLLDSGGNITDR